MLLHERMGLNISNPPSSKREIHVRSMVNDVLSQKNIEKQVGKYISAINEIMRIPYDKVGNQEIKDYILASPKYLKQQGKVFYMNSCVPRTLLLLSEMNDAGMGGDTVILLDVYKPIRKDYKKTDGTFPTTLHVALEHEVHDKKYTLQFFDKAWYIDKGGYVNPEPTIQRVLSEPVRISLKDVKKDDNIKDILALGPMNDSIYQGLVNNFDYVLCGIVERLVKCNTQEEFMKEKNQAFIQNTPIRISL